MPRPGWSTPGQTACPSTWHTQTATGPSQTLASPPTPGPTGRRDGPRSSRPAAATTASCTPDRRADAGPSPISCPGTSSPSRGSGRGGLGRPGACSAAVSFAGRPAHSRPGSCSISSARANPTAAMAPCRRRPTGRAARTRPTACGRSHASQDWPDPADPS